MGYRSWFTITSTWSEEYEALALSTGIRIHDIVKRTIQKISRYQFNDLHSNSERTSILTSPNEIKWYEWSEDMEKISRELPAVLFQIYMDGEDSEDHQQLIAKDGNVAISFGEIVYWRSDKERKAYYKVLQTPDIISPKHFIMND